MALTKHVIAHQNCFILFSVFFFSIFESFLDFQSKVKCQTKSGLLFYMQYLHQI